MTFVFFLLLNASIFSKIIINHSKLRHIVLNNEKKKNSSKMFGHFISRRSCYDRSDSIFNHTVRAADVIFLIV
jgi:hypothetical protein